MNLNIITCENNSLTRSFVFLLLVSLREPFGHNGNLLATVSREMVSFILASAERTAKII